MSFRSCCEPGGSKHKCVFTFVPSRRYKVVRKCPARLCRISNRWLELTVKHLVPGDEGHPHTLAAVFHQVLKVQFALLDEVLLHL